MPLNLNLLVNKETNHLWYFSVLFWNNLHCLYINTATKKIYTATSIIHLQNIYIADACVCFLHAIQLSVTGVNMRVWSFMDGETFST